MTSLAIASFRANSAFFPTSDLMEQKLLITPKTKILQLLESYPELESVLIDAAPLFEKLKNPVLRKTVARVTTIQQAAVIGRLRVDELLNKLRAAVGQDQISGTEEMSFVTEKPRWFLPERISGRLDIHAMLDSGEQPIHILIPKLQNLRDGAIFQVISPFIPAPLIDKATSLEMLHWVEEGDEGMVKIYFTRAP